MKLLFISYLKRDVGVLQILEHQLIISIVEHINLRQATIYYQRTNTCAKLIQNKFS